jgi:hypothetical protein
MAPGLSLEMPLIWWVMNHIIIVLDVKHYRAMLNCFVQQTVNIGDTEYKTIDLQLGWNI